MTAVIESTLTWTEAQALQEAMPASDAAQSTNFMSADEMTQTVAALYVHEQERQAGRAAFEGQPFEPQPFYHRFREAFAETPQGRIHLLRDSILAANTPPPVAQPNFNDLMTQAATDVVRLGVQREFIIRLANREQAAAAVRAGLGAAATGVSVEQARWELEHGLTFGEAAGRVLYSHERELGGTQRRVFATWKAVRGAFARHEGQPLSPQELARTMAVAPGVASLLFSRLVEDGALIRDVDNNTLAPAPHLAPRPRHLLMARIMKRFSRRAK